MKIIQIALLLLGLAGILGGFFHLFDADNLSHAIPAFVVMALGGVLIGSACVIEVITNVRESVDKARESINRIWRLIKDHRDKLDRDKPDSSDDAP